MSSLVISDRVVADSPLLTLNFDAAKELVRKAHEGAGTPVPDVMTRQTFLIHLHHLGARLDEPEDVVFFPQTILLS